MPPNPDIDHTTSSGKRMMGRMDSQEDSREEGGSPEDAELHKTVTDSNEKKTEAKQESQDELNVRNGNVATNEVLR